MRGLITLGGLGTIASVVLILAFLVWVVLPLFAGSSLSPVTVASSPVAQAPLGFGLDESGQLCWTLAADGKVEVRWLVTGEVLERRPIASGEGVAPLSAAPRSLACSLQGPEIALGLADGQVRLGKLGFAQRFVEPGSQLELDRALAVRSPTVVGGALVERTPGGQLRLVTLEVALEPPIDSGSTHAIVDLDLALDAGGSALCVLDEQGQLILERVSRSENLITGEVTLDTSRATIPVDRSAHAEAPAFARITGARDSIVLAWRDGSAQRYDVRKPEQAALAESFRLCPADTRLQTVAWSLGQTTLLCGDARGGLSAWFGTKPAQARTRDGLVFTRAHQTPGSGSPLVALAPSARSRVLAAAHADGTVELVHITSWRELGRVESSASTLALALAPKEDRVVLLAPDGAHAWQVELGHPEAGLRSLFAPVWYEGYAKPEHVWQSTGGTDDFEPKLGLVPLVFGTLKATLYSMLFGAPIALLAALFTSEFLDKRLRTPLKSLIELMAGLPSVVLGFLAALVIAPFVQGRLAACLALFVCVPLALLAGAYAWQLLPQALVVRCSGLPRFALIALCLPLGVLLAFGLGPLFERVFFAGDMIAWLDGGAGSGIGGWLVLLLPLSALVAALLVGRGLGRGLRQRSIAWTRGQAARFDLLRFALVAVASIGLALGAGWILDGAGWDPRGGVLDGYVQRNALVVGFVMAFAVIPIVYTLAEDALASVPQHLRHASLGAGATPWQTALRVVVPAAMSGLFSALMVGLGRAVGETMIVLMATGNTPVLSWNVFNGFRTLSANLAVELPEAVRGSTHYRTLFLAALCLFALTFVVNTLAEIVRQRFRRRSVQL